jgi:hypothetical protein
MLAIHEWSYWSKWSLFAELACYQHWCRNLNQHPILGPGNLHIYGRYVQNGENLLFPSTRYSAIMLELDSTRSTRLATKFEPEQVLTTSVANSLSFLPIEQWVKSSRAFRGTLVDGVLQPGVRLDNGLRFTLNPTTAAAPEPTPSEKSQEKEHDASKSSIEAGWQREFRYLQLRDFVSATSLDPPLDSSLGLDLRRGFEPLHSIEGGLSLTEHDLDLRQREGELKRLSSHLLREASEWRGRYIPGLKSAADELESQKARLKSQLESQLERQQAWDRCEDHALKVANLEGRELILKAEVGQLKWMQMNWLWFQKLAKAEGALNRLAESQRSLRQREKILKQVMRDNGLEHELKRAPGGKERLAAASGREKAKGTISLQQEAKRSTPSGRYQKQAKTSASSKAEAESVLEFLNETEEDTPDALELFRRASGKP